MVAKEKILAGRMAVDAYREAHALLHQKPYYREVHADHTPLLVKLVNALEKLGFTSTETEFEPKKTEILAKFWTDSDLLNIQELGFASREDFEARANESDSEALEAKWS